MDRLPPKIVRRLVLAPAVLVLCLVLVAVSPIALVVAAVADVFIRGNWQTVRLVAFVVAYLVLEVIGLVAMFALWVASGFGLRLHAMHQVHYDFMRWWLKTINGVVRVLFRLKIFIEDRPVPRAGPILVFCRHAGPGNSMLLIGTLLVGYRRHPRIVMLAKLQWEPLYDVMLNRLPNRFITHDPSRREVYLDAIGEIASGLGDEDAFVLFPEGKDFTPRVRMRAIERLRVRGREKEAARAEKMAHMLPPRHNGVMSAIRNAPDADIVFVAHSVLEDVGSFKQLWGRVPLKHPIVARYWRIPPSEVPREQDALIEWLYEWWERIDAWITEREAAVKAGEASA